MSTKFYCGLVLVLAGGVGLSGCVVKAKGRATTGTAANEPPPPEPVHRPPPPVVHQPPPDRPPPTRVRHVWDTKGWVLLGEQQVQGKSDRDVITVGKKEGKFTRVMVVVDDSDLEMNDMTILFRSGEKFSPPLKHYFRENERTRSIDLPEGKRYIETVSFRYGNFAGGGQARVQIWGLEAAPGPVAGGGGGDAKILKANWDRGGWTMLGKTVVKGKKDSKAVLKVGKGEGPFTKLMVVVEDSDIEMDTMTVTFGNKEKFEPEVKHFFRADTRTRAIDLPGEARKIKKIEFIYRNLPGGGKARVEVWAREK